MKKGFTLIELMVVVALIFLLSGLILPTSYSFLQKSEIRDQLRNVESSLRKAQAVSITDRGDSSSGIKFSQTNYILFEGESYLNRREAMDTVFNFPVAISVAGAQEVVFQKTTGLPVFPGLIGHWNFNEATGTIVYDSSCCLNQNNGIISGTGIWSHIDGKDGSALDLGGNAYVNIENNDSLNLENEITISSWVNIPTIDSGGIIKKGNPEGGNGYNFFISGEGAVVFSLGEGSSARTISNNYNSELLGEWVYLAAVWDGVKMKQYINGELQLNTDSFSGSVSSSTEDLIIGNGLIGKIDDVRLYNYAFSDEDVKTNYLARKDDIVVGLKFGENRQYIIINSQGKIEAIE